MPQYNLSPEEAHHFENDSYVDGCANPWVYYVRGTVMGIPIFADSVFCSQNATKKLHAARCCSGYLEVRTPSRALFRLLRAVVMGLGLGQGPRNWF